MNPENQARQEEALEVPAITVEVLTQAFTNAFAAVLPAPAAEPAPIDDNEVVPNEVLSAPTAENRFRREVRTANELIGSSTSIPNWKRQLLKPVDLEKYRINATRGLTDKFSLMSVSGSSVDGVELLQENVDTTKLIDKVKEHCVSYGMDDVFNIVTPNATVPGTILPEKTKDLFDDYSTLTKAQVQTSIRFYREHGQDYDLNNLRWSANFLSNCCDKNLSAKMDERMANYSTAERGGPLYFFEMMQAILTLTTDAATLMKDKLRTLKMQDFLGEDVHRAATLIRGTIKRLQMIDDVPSDLTKQLIAIFLTCSVPEFVQIFSTITSLHTLGPLTGGVTYEPASIIEIAESAYIKLSTVWNVPNNAKSSTFLTQNRDVTCWGCGAKGHTIDDCPHKSDAEKKKIRDEHRRNFKNDRKNSGGSNGKSGDGSGLTPNQLLKAAPKPGEKQTKFILGKDRKWCAICKKWTLTHGTAQHRGKKKDNADSPPTETPSGGANTAQTGGTRQLTFNEQISQQLQQGRN